MSRRRHRTPTDNSKALTHVVRKRPGLTLLTSGHVLSCTSSTADPVCQKPPSDHEVDAMISHDIVEHYLVTAKSSNIAPSGVFDKRAVEVAANEFGRSSWGIRDVLRKAGYGRSKTTARSR